MHNVWLPGDKSFGYNSGAIITYETGEQGAAQVFTIPDASSGFGVVAEQFEPVLEITKPPKLMYSSNQACRLGIKDSDGWVWEAPMPKQTEAKERGWAWTQFNVGPIQDPDKQGQTPPTAPATGNIKAIQIHGEDSVLHPVVVKLNYIAGRSPDTVNQGEVRQFKLESRDSGALELHIGDVNLAGAIRRPIKYLGALPFGYMVGGPSRGNTGTAPYRGPYLAGYQNGAPWVESSDPKRNTRLLGLVTFMSNAQDRFKELHPQKLDGPFMHCYLPATWDSEQTGELDTWVWDAPDGNPAWNGWQYRAFEGIGRTIYATKDTPTNQAYIDGVKVATRFFAWLENWLGNHPDAKGVPDNWDPPGWTQGQPFPKDSYLDPKYEKPDSHAIALALKGVITMVACGILPARTSVVCKRLLNMSLALQYTGDGPMNGAMTLNPTEYEVYGFHQGEVLGAWAWYKKYQDLIERG